MSFDDWALALHVLSAFAYVAGLLLFWVLVVAVRKVDTPDGTIRLEPVVKIGNAAVGIGAGGTIVLGIWLAFSVGGYDIWDGWIVAAIVLWLVAAEIGRRTGAAYMQGMTKAQELRTAGQTGPSAELLAINRTTKGVVLHAAASAVLLLILIDILAGASALAFARGEARLLRLGYWSLVAVSLPGWVLMRIGAGWISIRRSTGTTFRRRSAPLGLASAW